MWKLINITGVLLFFCSSQLSAQMLLGVKGGLNYSTFVGRDVNNAGFKPGYHGGLYLKIYTQDKTGFQIEAIVSLRGNKKNTGTIDTINSWKFEMMFVGFPLLLSTNYKNFSLITGLEPSFLLRAESDIDGKKTSLEDFYNPFSIALLLGVLYEINNGLNLGTRVEYGLLNLLDETIVGNKVAHSLNIQVSIGFTFGKRFLKQ